ncbi:hypothetical protein NQ317_009617 [Molorchus minor]|uniref:Uncharacterized protein n=1 Tax=Molorchus minor TaxID=1323400 RepID=A0ABQ9JLK2_9CUCU|nr:hypothetical protein NQ317_009617 [Molorchus minor]
MTLCDPYAINFLATSAIKILQHLIHNEGMPRDNTILILLLRMLALGLSAWILRTSRNQKLDSQVVTKFLPALMSLMVDDQVRHLSAKLPPDEREAAITVIEHSGPLPDAVEAYIQDSAVASILAMYYTLHVAKIKDRVGLLRILTVCLLIHNAEEFQAEDFCTALFDEFFFAGLSRDNVTRHLLKLLWYDKIHSQEEATIPNEVDIDLNSPLMSVPTPAPYHHTL